MPTRTFTRAQLDTLGLPHDLATEENAAEYPEAAVELHCEQVDTRRWVSVHELIFRAPDDGKAYRVSYEQGLTEIQEDTDPWGYANEVEAVEVEQVPVSAMEWQPVGDKEPPAAAEPETPFGDRHGPTPDETRLALVDGRDALAAVIIRPAADDPDRVTVEASARGMSKAAAAYALRRTADQFDAAALAEGDEPIPYTLTEQAEAAAVEEAPEDTARRLARRLAAVEHLCSGKPGYHSITVKALLTAMGEADEPNEDDALVAYLGEHGYPEGEAPEQAAETVAEAQRPAEGDRYVKREAPDAGRIVTVNRVWEAEDGHTAVAYEWDDPRASLAGSACPLDVFHRTYEAAGAQPTAPTWQDRADHAVRLYAQTAIERDDALAEVKKLRTYVAEQARNLAEQITTLGEARGWSTWAADYIHPDREFVDTGARDDAEAQQ